MTLLAHSIICASNIGALRQLQLHRMEVIHRPAVMTGDIPAFEATIQHMAVRRMLRAHRFKLPSQPRSTAQPVKSTQIEIR